MPDTKPDPDDTLARSPKDGVTPPTGQSDRAGTEAEEKHRPPEPPGDGPGRAGERAAAYRENDA